MISQELTTTWTRAALVVLSSAGMLAGIIAYVRISGLRSFSKMSSFDFAVTVAFGSLLAGVAVTGSSLIDGLIAGASLLGIQAAIARGRYRFGLGRMVDNDPLLLMANGRFLDDHLRRSRVTRNDVRGKLREANVGDYREVRAVVLETTGDISVLHGSGELDLDILDNVIGVSELRS